MKLKWVKEKSGYTPWWHAEVHIPEELEAVIEEDETGDREDTYYSWSVAAYPIDEGSQDVADGQEDTLEDAMAAAEEAIQDYLDELEEEEE